MISDSLSGVLHSPASSTTSSQTECARACRAEYGPEVDSVTPKIEAVTVAPDGLSARLTISGLTKGHVHDLKSTGVHSAAGHPSSTPTPATP